MTSTPDARLLAAHDIARAALAEITPASTVGDAAGYTVSDDGVVSLRFLNNLPGYPGWFWTVSVAVVEDAEPTVLELQMLPGEDALLAADWVPWAERLAVYRATLAAAGEASDDDDAEADEDEDDEDSLDFEDELDDLDDLDDLDAADFDEDGSPHLEEGDVDGVDIDSMDDSDNYSDDADDADDEAEDIADVADED